jgi:shikimate kinase
MEIEQELTEGIHDPAIFKVVFLAGGPGSGKSFVVGKTALTSLGFRVVNSDDIYEVDLKKAGLKTTTDDIFSERGQQIRAGSIKLTRKKMIIHLKNRLGIVVDGTGRDSDALVRQAAEFRKLGYDISMIFVNTSLDVAIERDKNRSRTIGAKNVTKLWDQVQQNIGRFQRIFKNEFHLIDNSKSVEEARRWSPSGSLDKQTLSTYKKIATWSKKFPNNRRAVDWKKKHSKMNEKVNVAQSVIDKIRNRKQMDFHDLVLHRLHQHVTNDSKKQHSLRYHVAKIKQHIRTDLGDKELTKHYKNKYGIAEGITKSLSSGKPMDFRNTASGSAGGTASAIPKTNGKIKSRWKDTAAGKAGFPNPGRNVTVDGETKKARPVTVKPSPHSAAKPKSVPTTVKPKPAPAATKPAPVTVKPKPMQLAPLDKSRRFDIKRPGGVNKPSPHSAAKPKSVPTTVKPKSSIFSKLKRVVRVGLRGAGPVLATTTAAEIGSAAYNRYKKVDGTADNDKFHADVTNVKSKIKSAHARLKSPEGNLNKLKFINRPKPDAITSKPKRTVGGARVKMEQVDEGVLKLVTKAASILRRDAQQVGIPTALGSTVALASTAAKKHKEKKFREYAKQKKNASVDEGKLRTLARLIKNIPSHDKPAIVAGSTALGVVVNKKVKDHKNIKAKETPTKEAPTMSIRPKARVAEGAVVAVLKRIAKRVKVDPTPAVGTAAAATAASGTLIPKKSGKKVSMTNEVYNDTYRAKMKKTYRGKYPHHIAAVGGLTGKKGVAVVVTNSGDRHEIHAKDSGHKMPETGTHINKWKPGAVSEGAVGAILKKFVKRVGTKVTPKAAGATFAGGANAAVAASTVALARKASQKKSKNEHAEVDEEVTGTTNMNTGAIPNPADTAQGEKRRKDRKDRLYRRMPVK